MSISMDSCRRAAVGGIGAGMLAGALLVGADAAAQAAPAAFSAVPPAAVQSTGAQFAPAAVGAPFATDLRTAPLPQWGPHHRWWGHHHWWRHWWWWW